MRAFAISLALALTAALVVGPAAANRKPRLDKRKLALDYRWALDRLARGDAGGAVADLVELESRAGADRGAKADLEPLWKAELSVIRDLLGAGAEVLVPLSQLHEQAYLAHLARKSHSLATHSRSLTIELAELCSERVKGSRGKRLASAVMTSMAGRLQASYADTTAATLYRRAADLDPGNAAALLGLAGIYERHGEYDEALPLLERLIEVAPGNQEGRLRLAVHLRRLERPDESEDVLRGLVRERVKEPRWVHSLAYQELARILIDRDELAEAARLIEEGVRSMGEDPTLPILLAYVTDRDGRPSGKAELRAALRAPGRAEEDSPRYRYSRMPRQALDQLRLTLRGESAAQLPTLAEALSGGAEQAPAGSR